MGLALENLRHYIKAATTVDHIVQYHHNLMKVTTRRINKVSKIDSSKKNIHQTANMNVVIYKNSFKDNDK